MIKENTFLFCTVKKKSSVVEPQNEKFIECSVMMTSISVVSGRIMDFGDSDRDLIVLD